MNDIAALNKRNYILWANINTAWIPAAQITLKGLFCNWIVFNPTIGTNQRTQSASQTFILVNPDDTITGIFDNRPRWTAVFARRFTALIAGYCRVDFRVDHECRPWILEVNANPCLSPDAGFAAAVSQAGITYTDAVSKIIADAVYRKEV